MFNVMNNYNSISSFLYKYIICTFSYYYLLILCLVFLLFLSYRIPYCYSPYLFSIFLLTVVFSMFISLFFRRLIFNLNEFLSSFVPAGTPLYICPIVCLAETISYIIRPLVLILRPFINISLGCFGAVALCNLCFVNYFWLVVLFILFFYEVFVAVVHWYIVTSILAFSIDH
uniref:ATP synthase subunit 6 n=1 Tax=Drepanidotaenia lanceolata TaxID=1732538 RepID=A0A0N9QJM8_9CEST|nr:ATP synthase F0 subunit 6 [Drepanidotaenia lanceolata]ALH16573.1 ATP synthase subunit 6 [Drepanidotaenia lanceolata]